MDMPLLGLIQFSTILMYALGVQLMKSAHDYQSRKVLWVLPAAPLALA